MTRSGEDRYKDKGKSEGATRRGGEERKDRGAEGQRRRVGEARNTPLLLCPSAPPRLSISLHLNSPTPRSHPVAARSAKPKSPDHRPMRRSVSLPASTVLKRECPLLRHGSACPDS